MCIEICDYANCWLVHENLFMQNALFAKINPCKFFKAFVQEIKSGGKFIYVNLVFYFSMG